MAVCDIGSYPCASGCGPPIVSPFTGKSSTGVLVADLDSTVPGSEDFAGNENWKLARPLGTAVMVLIAIVAALNVVRIVILLCTGGRSLRDPQCAGLPLNGIAVSAAPSVPHLRPGVTAGVNDQVTACVRHATGYQHVLAVLAGAPQYVLFAAVLVLLFLLLRKIETAGPFTVPVARRLRFLGWFVLAGYLIATSIQGVTEGLFDSTVVTGHVPVAANVLGAEEGGFLLPLLICCGLLTIARIMRAGAESGRGIDGELQSGWSP